jgi:hypothetical protein
MAGDLNTNDINQLKARLTDLESQLQASIVSAENIQNSAADAEAQERAYKKDWDYFNRIIRTYEKEIEYLNGEYIAKPIQEKDLQDHVRNRGRLYQPGRSLDPIKIREQVGKGLAKNKRTEREDRIVQQIDNVIKIFRDGNGPNSGPASNLYTDFSPGDRFIFTEDQLSANTWYLIGGRVYVKVGAGVFTENGTCVNPQYTSQVQCELNGDPGDWTPLPPSYKHQVIERLTFPNAEVAINQGASVAIFSGFSNASRASEVVTGFCSIDPEINTNAISCGLAGGVWTDPPTAFFNVLKNGLLDLLNRWKSLLQKENKQLDLADRDDPEFDKTTPQQINNDQIAYIDQYIADGTPLDDNTPGFNELESETSARLAYIPTRVSDATNEKKKYYGDRIQLTNGRANRQAGSLFRTLFVADLAGDFPISGDPDIKTEIERLKRRIRQLEND